MFQKKQYQSSSHSGQKFPQKETPYVKDNERKIMYVNEQIKASKIMIIDEDGKNMGTFPRDVALQIASDQGKDLYQIAYNPQEFLSTVKLVDLGKYLYDKQKEEKEKKKNQKAKGLKDIKFGYTIGENDLMLKITKSKEMLGDGYGVRFSIKLKGREKAFAHKALEKLKFVENQLLDEARSQGIKEEASGYSVVLLAKNK